jgi:hypothetical protein
MANRYQTALMDRLGTGTAQQKRVDAPGLQPGIVAKDPAGPLEMTPPPSTAGPVDYQSLLMGALQKNPYGQAGYAAAEKELGGSGIQFQKNSAGQYRGRVKLPNGDIVDTALNEGNDNAFLGGGQGTTGAYGFLNRGQEGLDAGGWSFGGPGKSQSMPFQPLPVPTGGETLPVEPQEPSPFSSSPYLEALLQQLRVV